jgi:SH3-like domain-containing protein
MLGSLAGTAALAKDSTPTTSGLPVPRYVSLKSDHVNVRAGPTKDNDVAWVYTRSGLPVEITAEYENWRRVRDSEGSEKGSAVTARLQAGVITQVKKCNSTWCHVIGNGFDGWVEQQRLWGVYSDEQVN